MMLEYVPDLLAFQIPGAEKVNSAAYLDEEMRKDLPQDYKENQLSAAMKLIAKQMKSMKTELLGQVSENKETVEEREKQFESLLQEKYLAKYPVP